MTLMFFMSSGHLFCRIFVNLDFFLIVPSMIRIRQTVFDKNTSETTPCCIRLGARDVHVSHYWRCSILSLPLRLHLPDFRLKVPFSLCKLGHHLCGVLFWDCKDIIFPSRPSSMALASMSASYPDAHFWTNISNSDSFQIQKWSLLYSLNKYFLWLFSWWELWCPFGFFSLQHKQLQELVPHRGSACLSPWNLWPQQWLWKPNKEV